MSDIVKVPVELVADLDLSQVDVKDVQKTLESKLSGIRDSMKQIFAQVNTSKATKPLLDGIKSVESSFTKLNNAHKAFNAEMTKAGKSTSSYKQVAAELDAAKAKLVELEQTRSNWEDDQGNFKGTSNMWQYYLEACEKYELQLGKVHELQKQVNDPGQFVKDADPTTQANVESSYRKLISTVASFNQEAQKFNNTLDMSKTTQGYQDLEKRATQLTNKLKEYNDKSKDMAESIHTTDRQWESLQNNTKKASSELDSVLRKMRELVKTGNALAVGNDSSGLTNQIKSMNATRRNIAGYGKQVGTVDARANANRNPYTAEYQEELKNFQKIEQAIDKLIAKYKELQALGKLTPDGLAKMKYEAEQLQGKLDESTGKLTEMVNNGSAFRLGQGNTESELSGINSRLDDSKAKLNEVAGASAQMGTNLRSANTAVQSLTKTVNKAAKGLLRCVTGAVLLGKQGKSTGNSLTKVFKTLQRNLMMYGFGFRTIYYAIKRLRTLFIKEFQLMAQQSSEINSQVTSLTMSFNRLKGSLAVAFQPLATVVIPILQTAMNYLTGFLESIGRFMATLTGQSYVFKAVAKNIDSVSKSAKEAKKQLGSYDKLDVISKDEGSGGAGDDLGIDYEKVGLDGGSNFARLVKEAWEKQDFTEVGLVIGNKLVEALNSVQWGPIREKAKGIANSIATLINGFFSTPDLGQSVGNSIANALGTAIDFAFKLITTLDFEQAGIAASNAINTFLTKMAEVDETGLSGWGKLAQSYSGLVRGILELIITAMQNTDWHSVGQAIGDYISNLDWKGVILDFTTLAGEILRGIGEALKGWAEEDPISAALAVIIVGAIGSLNLASKIIPVVMKGKVLKEFFGMAKAIKDGGGATGSASSSIGEAATETENISNATSGLSTKLTTFAKNLGVGLLILLEVAAAAVIFLGAIWVIGKLLKEIGEAWQPVLDNGENIAIAIGIGTGILVAVGAACFGLGVSKVAGGTIAVAIGLGMLILAEMGAAAILFLAEIWAIGKALNEIRIAWEPVLANAETVEYAIKTGTKLLVAIGVVTAALGAASVASVGLLPLAIALGTKLLVDLAKNFIKFCDSLEDVAEKLQELAPVLKKLTSVLPGLKTDMHTFTEFMKGFAGEVVKFTTANTIASIGTTINKVVSFFTADPIKTLYKEVKKQTGEFNQLIPALETINPMIEKATKLVGEYKSKMGSFDNAVGGGGGFLGTVVKGAKGVINGLISMFEGMANGVIKCINALIAGLNKIKFDVPDWVPAIGGKKFGFNIKQISQVSIPRLAQGAVIPPNKEFLAMLGDQKHGTNIEAPLDTIKQALAEVMAEFGRGSNNPIILQLDGKTVAKVVWDEEAKYYKQTGKYSPAY